MKPELASLELTRSDLEKIRRAMAAKIQEGLLSGEGEIAALPTFIPPPPTGKEGAALAIDLGGSNIRAAVIEISPEGGAKPVGEPAVRPLETEWESAAVFFDRQAELALSLGPPAGLPLGYCFSYPTRALPGGDAVHLQWNKELRVPGVIGQEVGKLLREALERQGYFPRRVRVINDTVAALLGGDLVYRPQGGFATFIGLVVGTGTNMAAYFPSTLLGEKIPEESRGREPMAINLESGNFHPPRLSHFDDKLDAGRRDAGQQRLEKAVAGKFIPQLFSYIFEGRTAGPYPEAREIFELAGTNRSTGGEIARRLVNRSADLVAACLAGLVDVLETEDRVGILAEGGVISNNRSYRERVKRKLSELLKNNHHRPSRFKLLQLGNANLIGAAAAVA